MYNASQAFHEAVRGNEPQLALLIFNDAVFTNSDLKIENGLEFHDYFNTEEDIAIGQALSNEIRFTLFNDDRLLNDYEFGTFKALLGVRISKGTYKQRSPVMAFNGNDAWAGNARTPYLTLNGTAVSSQPMFPVRSIAIYNGKVYVFGTLGYYKVYDTSGAVVSETLNSFMVKKVSKWNNIGFTLDVSNRTLDVYAGGESERYEFVPLGTFIAERPDSPDKISIDLTCHDQMELFDKDMPDATTLGMTYSNSTTVGTLFEKLCKYVDVPYQSGAFMNSDATISKEPSQFKNANMRTVIGWIAEVAGSNAGFNRDGTLVLKWLNSNTGQVFDEGTYSSCVPKYYTTPTVTKLYNRNTSGGADVTYGGGDSGYLIQDNPLMNG